MKKKYVISVIIPIYNAERYLVDCLNSVKKQTFKNYEVILINDGSTDDSEKICENFCNSSKNFRLINQKNSGVSHSRNIGISLAIGDIIMFLDSDDFLESNALLEVATNFYDNDLICFGYNYVYKDKVQKNELTSCENLDEMKNSIYFKSSVGGYLWNKAFKRDIIINNDIKMNERINFCEDLLFISQYIKYCDKILCISKYLYNYRMRNSSVTFNFYNKKNLSILNAYELLIDTNKENKPVYFEFCYRYIYNYYYLKSLIKKYNFNVNYLILKQEKKILAKKSLKDKMKLYFVKFMPNLFIFLKKYKIKKSNLFE